MYKIEFFLLKKHFCKVRPRINPLQWPLHESGGENSPEISPLTKPLNTLENETIRKINDGTNEGNKNDEQKSESTDNCHSRDQLQSTTTSKMAENSNNGEATVTLPEDVQSNQCRYIIDIINIFFKSYTIH